MVLHLYNNKKAKVKVTRAPDSEFLFIEMGTLKFYDWLIDWL